MVGSGHGLVVVLLALAMVPGSARAQAPVEPAVIAEDGYGVAAADVDLEAVLRGGGKEYIAARGRIEAHPEVAAARIEVRVARADVTAADRQRLAVLAGVVAGPELQARVEAHSLPPPRAALPVTREPALFVPKPPSGYKLIVAGSVVGGLGLIAGIAGVARLIVVRQESERIGYHGIPTVAYVAAAVGPIMVLIGAPLLGVGVTRRRAWLDWQEERKVVLRPVFGRSARGTWTAGLALRF